MKKLENWNGFERACFCISSIVSAIGFIISMVTMIWLFGDQIKAKIDSVTTKIKGLFKEKIIDERKYESIEIGD